MDNTKFALSLQLNPNHKLVNFSKFDFAPTSENTSEDLELVVDITHEDHGLIGQVGFKKEPDQKEKFIAIAEALANLALYGKATPKPPQSHIQPIAFDPTQGKFYRTLQVFEESPKLTPIKDGHTDNN
jgi:hypothetical protein